MNTIYYWADGTWCYKCEYNMLDYGWKSDDFGKFTISDDETEEHIQVLVDELIS